jgi:cytochrome c
MNKIYIVGVLITCLLCSCSSHSDQDRILVFSKTAGYKHASIPAGIEAIIKLGSENGFEVDTTKSGDFFNDERLKRYRAVVFLNTTQDVLNSDQQVAFERYIQAGGGYVGIHAAADTEYEWPWYNKLVGAYFQSHPNDPNVRQAVINVVDTAHQAMRNLPLVWTREDEWYNYKKISLNIKVLATLDENSYEGGENGDFHPIAWFQDYDGGRAFYTGGGHTIESFSEPLFLQHLLGGLKYAMGENIILDYKKAYAVKTPEENRFIKTILSNDLNEPMELAVTNSGEVYFIERSGGIYLYRPDTGVTLPINKIAVMPDTEEGFGNGLLGITLDPDFKKNKHLYLFYTPDKLPVRQNISRFKVNDDGSLDLNSEKVIIEIPLELEKSAHTGGSMAWDKKGNLYIATGDNTVPFASDGFAPLDETPGRITFDAQRSSANTNDLRGKILRIHPEKDGSYSIPEGNLFPKETAETRPEIYVMGCRNPYRISVDAATSILYWGEIGPDSGTDGPQGPRGYDEINQAKSPGNYGWPYFVGNNKPYHDFDFVSRKVGALYDSASVINESPNNKGMRKIPSPRSAMVWYPYDKSNEFTDVGTGGRSAMAGPVYHFEEDSKSEKKFPAYYDKTLFIFDWMRNWVFAVRMDNEQKFLRLHQFMPLSGDFRRPIDMEFASDGTLYVLEYGSVYGVDNPDARLTQVKYNMGNRPPQAKIAAGDTIGLAPFKVIFGNSSYDHDESDVLSYEWKVEGKSFRTKELTYTFSKNGLYNVVLIAKDPAGGSSVDSLNVYVGNTMPKVKIATNENTTFFFTNNEFAYNVIVEDKEDKEPQAQNIKIINYYVARYNAETMGHQEPSPQLAGKTLMANSDCKACHQLNAKSVGPAFMQVADRYKDDKTAVKKLSAKIIRGGGGVWGEHAMNAHPQLSLGDASEIVRYILSLSSEAHGRPSLPSKGSMKFSAHKDSELQGRYFIKASYTDNGGQAVPLTASDMLMLRPSRVQAEDADVYKNVWRGSDQMLGIKNKTHLMFKEIDLKHIRSLMFDIAGYNPGGKIEVRMDALKGPVIGELTVPLTGGWDSYKKVKMPLKTQDGKHDLFFVFLNDEKPKDNFCNVDWIEFRKQ